MFGSWLHGVLVVHRVKFVWGDEVMQGVKREGDGSLLVELLWRLDL